MTAAAYDLTDAGPISAEALDVMLHEEGFAGRPYWPKGASGVTLDYGYDLGRKTLALFTVHWRHLLALADFEALVPALGVRGQGARLLLESGGLARIRVTRAMANHVFRTDSLPEYLDETFDAFPGLYGLPRDVIGALTSLVYNRGPSMEDDAAKRAPGDRRLEMRELRSAVAAFGAVTRDSGRRAALLGMATALDRMGERVFAGAVEPNPTLRARRHREAALIRGAAQLFLSPGGTP